jgi:hypothetical protein
MAAKGMGVNVRLAVAVAALSLTWRTRNDNHIATARRQTRLPITLDIATRRSATLSCLWCASLLAFYRTLAFIILFCYHLAWRE